MASAPPNSPSTSRQSGQNHHHLQQQPQHTIPGSSGSSSSLLTSMEETTASYTCDTLPVPQNLRSRHHSSRRQKFHAGRRLKPRLSVSRSRSRSISPLSYGGSTSPLDEHEQDGDGLKTFDLSLPLISEEVTHNLLHSHVDDCSGEPEDSGCAEESGRGRTQGDWDRDQTRSDKGKGPAARKLCVRHKRMADGGMNFKLQKVC